MKGKLRESALSNAIFGRALLGRSIENSSTENSSAVSDGAESNQRQWLAKPTFDGSVMASSKALLISSLLSLMWFSGTANSQTQQGPNELVNFKTQVQGIYEVTHQDLLAAGVDLRGIAATDISLYNLGAEVHLQVTGGDEFNESSKIRFVAKELDTLYTDTNVYTLNATQNTKPIVPLTAPFNARLPWAVSYMETVEHAPQNQYSFSSPDRQDPWYAKRMVALGQETSENITMVMDELAPGGNSGDVKPSMTVSVWGATDLPGELPDHHFRAAFNGVNVIDERFDGLSARTFNVDLEEVTRVDNTIRLSLPGQEGVPFDAVNLNSVTVKYPRRFIANNNALEFESRQSKFRIRGFEPNTTNDNNRPDLEFVAFREDSLGMHELTVAQSSCRRTCTLSLSGGAGQARYYVSSTSALNKPAIEPLPVSDDISSGQARYLIISHPDFIGTAGSNLLEAYADELRSEMGSVDIVSVDTVYAQFGAHIFGPDAIKNYIAYATQQRGTEYVLLVGSDVYDYRQFENQNATSFIPSIYAATGNNITFAPVDAKYVDLDDDNVPDLPIARLPVRTTGHLASLLAKRTAYLNRDYAGQALMVADEFDAVQQYDFDADADEIQASFLDNFDIQNAYVDDIGASAARQQIRSVINQGTSLAAFFGHSSTNQWGFGALFTGPDAANLSNAGKPTVVTQWGCWNAYYVSPNEDSMGHRFLIEGDRGAVTVMGASTLTNADAERRLAKRVFERIAKGERLGDAVTNAKQDYALTNPDDLDVLLGWTVLGLPELVIN